MNIFLLLKLSTYQKYRQLCLNLTALQGFSCVLTGFSATERSPLASRRLALLQARRGQSVMEYLLIFSLVAVLTISASWKFLDLRDCGLPKAFCRAVKDITGQGTTPSCDAKCACDAICP